MIRICLIIIMIASIPLLLLLFREAIFVASYQQGYVERTYLWDDENGNEVFIYKDKAK